jgi:hypothetical protein
MRSGRHRQQPHERAEELAVLRQDLAQRVGALVLRGQDKSVELRRCVELGVHRVQRRGGRGFPVLVGEFMQDEPGVPIGRPVSRWKLRQHGPSQFADRHVGSPADRKDFSDERQIDAIGKKPAAAGIPGVARVTGISGVARVSGVARIASHSLHPPFLRPPAAGCHQW